jgi:diguanylate cyclase (GGDEF)-like protein
LFNPPIFTIASLLLTFSFIFFFLRKPDNLLFFLPVALCGIVFLIFRKLHQAIVLRYHGEFDKIEEKINLLTESVDEKKEALKSIPSKRERVSFLFNASQKLIELIDTENVFDFLTNALGDLFPQADNILVFDFDKAHDSLSLLRSLKRKDPVIKEKRGDELEKWVLRRNSSLLVEDINKDFRFDYNKIRAYKERKVSSFLASPLSVGHHVMGTVRLESKAPGEFSFDDSRLLRNVCDLGAVVLERAYLFRRAEDLAIRDSLTDLFVKDYFFQRLQDELERSRGSKKLGIIMLDIDDFKRINDTYGHVVGDAILIKLAKILGRITGQSGNILARFGGEEFIVLLVECSRERLLGRAEDIRKAVEDSSLVFRRKKVNFTVSAGAALYPDDAAGALELVDKADKLLYKAKREGKNRVCFSGE